ncbi:MAG: SpoIIE family protein phosphatase [bacterium]
MFKAPEREQLKVPAHIDYLGDLRDFVTQIGKKHDFSDKLINAFKLAIDEAATNIIRHAYREKEGLITIRAIVKKKSLTIALIDQGTFFDPKRVKDPDLKRYVAIGKKGGLGIFIMRKLMDEIDYRKTEEGNELRVTKYREPLTKKSWLESVTSIPLSLKAKYFFRTISIITVMIAASYIYYYLKAGTKVIADFITSGRATANQIVNLISAATTDKDDMFSLSEKVDGIYVEEYREQIKSITIEDSSGAIIYSPDIEEDLLLPYHRPADYVVIEDGLYQYVDKDGTPIYEFEIPIVKRTSGKFFGKAHVVISREPADAQIKAVHINDLKLWLSILGVSYVGVALLIYIVMIPFRKLSVWVKALGHGEIEDEMDIDATTEIGEIAQAFSDITHKFRESQKNLADQERLQKEMQVAQEIQQTLLPMEFPKVQGYELASYYEAAKEVGGDYYDFVEVDKDTLGIAVADVSGKGVPGSLVMTMIRTALRTEARGLKDAAEVLARVNEFVSGDMKKGMFVTIFYLIIDSKKRRLNYASAGHNPMILYRGSTKKTYYLNPKGFPIGIQLPEKHLFRNYIQSDTIQLAEDDILMVYTDGITEAMNSNRELFGEERLLHVMRNYGHLPAVPFVEKLKESIHSFTEGCPQYDDITLVAIKEESSREKDELRRAKEAHQLISDGKSIREACETARLTTYAYYNKYKKIFEEEGIDAFEIDEEVSVEAKHLSIEEKTKILDIIAHHPEYGAGRVSDELNTEKYDFTQISESKIYDELVRSRLNTRQLREAYVAKGKQDRRRLKPPGTPLLTLDGKIVFDRKEEIPKPAPADKPQGRIVKETEQAAPVEDQKDLAPPETEVEKTPEPPETTPESKAAPIPNKVLDSDSEADSLIGSSIEELLYKEDAPENPLESAGQQQDTQQSDEEIADGTKGIAQETDFIDGIISEATFSEENDEAAADQTDAQIFEDFSFGGLSETEPLLEEQQESDLSSDLFSDDDQVPENLEASQNDAPEQQEQEFDLDFLFDDKDDAKTEVPGLEDIEDSLTISVDELLLAENEDENPKDGQIVNNELSGPENKDSTAIDSSLDSDSFSDLIQSVEDEVVYLTEEDEPADSEASPPEQVENQQQEVEQEDKMRTTVPPSTATGSELAHSTKELQQIEAREKILIAGIKYYKNKNYDHAIKEFKKVIERYPDFKEAHSILGNAYFRNKMYTQAAMSYEKVKQMDPEDVTAYENMGVIYANRGNYKKAIDEWKKVLELNPERKDIERKIEKAMQMI